MSGVPVFETPVEKSDVSGRMALPEFMEQWCGNRKHALRRRTWNESRLANGGSRSLS